MLTDTERNLLAAMLSIGLKLLPDAPDLGIDFTDRPAVLDACRALVDRMPEERARFYLARMHIPPRPQRPYVDVLTSPAPWLTGGTLANTPKLEMRDNGALHTDVGHDSEDPAYDPERYNRVHEVVHLRTHDVVILACERDIVIMTSDEFHSQV